MRLTLVDLSPLIPQNRVPTYSIRICRPNFSARTHSLIQLHMTTMAGLRLGLSGSSGRIVLQKSSLFRSIDKTAANREELSAAVQSSSSL
jgi:hypothetical protein